MATALVNVKNLPKKHRPIYARDVMTGKESRNAWLQGWMESARKNKKKYKGVKKIKFVFGNKIAYRKI